MTELSDAVRKVFAAQGMHRLPESRPTPADYDQLDALPDRLQTVLVEAIGCAITEGMIEGHAQVDRENAGL